MAEQEHYRQYVAIVKGMESEQYLAGMDPKFTSVIATDADSARKLAAAKLGVKPDRITIEVA